MRATPEETPAHLSYSMHEKVTLPVPLASSLNSYQRTTSLNRSGIGNNTPMYDSMILPAIPASTAPSFDSYPRTTRLNSDYTGNTGPLPVDNKFSSAILSSNYLNENTLSQPIPVHTNEFLNQRDLKNA